MPRISSPSLAVGGLLLPLLPLLLAALLAALPAALPAQADDGALTSVEALGRALFHDVNLSANRTQACATCHNPDFGFADPSGRAASLGDDGTSLGDRNAPTLRNVAVTGPYMHNGVFKELETVVRF